MNGTRDRIAIQADIVTGQIERLKRLHPDLASDADLLAGMIEGETDFEAVLGRVTEAFLDAVAIKEAIASRMANLRERGDRYGRKAEVAKALAYGMMEAAGQTTVRLPDATLSIANGRNRLVVDDPDAIPQGYVKIERTPMRADIAAAIAGGDSIPGCHLEPGDKHLSIRTK